MKVDLRDKLFCTRGEMRKMERKRSVKKEQDLTDQ